MFASQAIGNRGKVIVGRAPEIPDIPEKADTVLLLDLLHYLNNTEIRQLFHGLKEALSPNGRLVIRVTILSGTTTSWMTFWELKRVRFFNIPAYFRQLSDFEKELNLAGFQIVQEEPSALNREEHWIIAEAV